MRYCNVRFENGYKFYVYLTDIEGLKEGDIIKVLSANGRGFNEAIFVKYLRKQPRKTKKYEIKKIDSKIRDKTKTVKVKYKKKKRSLISRIFTSHS